MIPAVSVVGWSGSGKTTLICKILPELKKMGYRVATLKHDFHGFGGDDTGKDSWLHRQAGAVISAVSSAQRFAYVQELEEELPLEDILSGIRGVDLILVEGYKRGPLPKVEVFRRRPGAKKELVSPTGDLVAIASDSPWEEAGVPVFSLEEGERIADFLAKKYLDPEGG